MDRMVDMTRAGQHAIPHLARTKRSGSLWGPDLAGTSPPGDNNPQTDREAAHLVGSERGGTEQAQQSRRAQWQAGDGRQGKFLSQARTLPG